MVKKLDETLLDKYKTTKDIKIRNQIIEECMPLVRFIVSRHYNPSYVEPDFFHEFEDLVQYGVFGLIKAIDKYDASKKVKFTTFAYQKIHYGIIDELRKVDQIPRTVRFKIKCFHKNVEILENTLGCGANIKQLAKEHNLSVKDMNVMEGTFMLALDYVFDHLCDRRELRNDYVLCGQSLGA